MSLSFDPDIFRQEPVLGIVRGVSLNNLQGVLDAARDAGLKHLEITLNTGQALDLISAAVASHGKAICLGAGTVRTLHQAEEALEAGARFLVSPALNEDVAAICRKREIPYFPGALTPGEIEKAWQAGAEMVKVFPSSLLGPSYFKELKGPLEDISLMAVGGVTPENIPDYLSSGASAVAVGGSVFSVSRMENKEFSRIHNHLKEILFAVKNFLNTIR